MQLNPGDALVLYTDGVTEAMDPGRRLFGIDAMRRTLSGVGEGAGSHRIVQGLLEEVRGFAGTAHQSDDITILVVRYLGRGERGSE